MGAWTEIEVDPSLLPQVARELLAIATNSNDVQTAHGERGQILLVHPEVADAWYEEHQKKVASEKVEDSIEPSIVASSDTSEPVVEGEPELQEDEEPEPVVPAALQPEPIPVKRGPGRPRKVTSASVSEVL